MSSEESLRLKIIGHVKNEIPSGKVNDWEGVRSEIILKDEYGPFLDGIEQFSHIVVVFWMHQVDEYLPKIHPKGRMDIPEQGVFATRTPFRPNPIGISAVRLHSRTGASLNVSGLDCYNDTPVLDIKPFTQRDSGTSDIRIPKWMEEIMKEKESG